MGEEEEEEGRDSYEEGKEVSDDDQSAGGGGAAGAAGAVVMESTGDDSGSSQSPLYTSLRERRALHVDDEENLAVEERDSDVEEEAVKGKRRKSGQQRRVHGGKGRRLEWPKAMRRIRRQLEAGKDAKVVKRVAPRVGRRLWRSKVARVKREKMRGTGKGRRKRRSRSTKGGGSKAILVKERRQEVERQAVRLNQNLARVTRGKGGDGNGVRGGNVGTGTTEAPQLEVSVRNVITINGGKRKKGEEDAVSGKRTVFSDLQ